MTDRSGIIYDDESTVDDTGTCTKKVNQLMLMKKKLDIAEFQTMKSWGEFGYCKMLAYKFGFFDSDNNLFTYKVIDENYSLDSYLESHVDEIMLQRMNRKELIAKIDVRSDGKQLKSISALNSALAERNIGYQIVQFETSRIVDGQKKNFKQAWKIIKAA